MADLRISGGTVRLPTGAVVDESISTATTIDADKLEHIHKAEAKFGLAIDDTPVTHEEIVFVASQDGRFRGFHALLNDTGTTTSIAFDLKVNGTTVLSGVVTIAHTDTDRDVLDGTISSAAFSAGDVVSIAMTVTSATGAEGPFAWADIEEIAP